MLEYVVKRNGLPEASSRYVNLFWNSTKSQKRTPSPGVVALLCLYLKHKSSPMTPPLIAYLTEFLDLEFCVVLGKCNPHVKLLSLVLDQLALCHGSPRVLSSCNLHACLAGGSSSS